MIVVDGPVSHFARPLRPRRCLFLDRDGVINVDEGWVHRREDFVWNDGIFDLTRAATHAGFVIVVVTNQAGIARGLYDEAAFRALSIWMVEQFQREGVQIQKVIGCPHHPDAVLEQYRRVCVCRKPKPGMLLYAAEALNIDMAASCLLGDHETDLQAGKAAGVGRLDLIKKLPLQWTLNSSG